MIRKVFLFFILLISGLMTQGQVLINEFCSANSSTIEDPDFHESADWIELYNAGTVAVNLQNFFLTDNFDRPDKWQITEKVMIGPGGYLLIWADGRGLGVHAGFKLSALGEEIGFYAPQGDLIDSISFGEQKSDISYGRVNDGSSDWAYFQEATPGASNSTEAYVDFVSSVPEFTPVGGFLSAALSVRLINDFDGEVRFTTDGSEPGPGSTLYSSPILLSSTTLIRARIFEADKISGPVVTHSYFINENAVGEALPVVSIASDPDNFWDPGKGIYVQDFKPLWEIPVNVELFENNGSDRAAFNERAGAKINGLNAWKLPQKMLGIYFRKQYGSGNLEYPLTHQRERSSYESFALRASGSDWSLTLFRDMLGQHATLLNMDLDILGFRPAVVYFNGDYMGIHNIREKVNDDYIEKSYSMEPGSFDLVENENYAEAGDLEAYHHLRSLFARDLSISANYEAVANLVDIENLTDFLIAEMANRNISIDHNVMAWKPKTGGKWRWVLVDLDRTFSNPSDYRIDFYESKAMLHLNDLLQNSSYANYFAGRMVAQLYTSFHPERMNRLIDEHAGDIEFEIPVHIERWLGATSSYGNAMPSVDYWKEKVCDLRIFVEERPATLLTDLQNYGFGEMANLSLATYPEKAGSIKLDGLVVPDSPWSGPCITNLGFQLAARAKPGYDFLGWATSQKQVIVPMGSDWKYLDLGFDAGITWRNISYNDYSWKSGPAELGYGDNDENTVISYGGDSQNKYITSYFRRVFTLSQEEREAAQFGLTLLKDDGAVVYLNGVEIFRANMVCGAINYLTPARFFVDGASESSTNTYMVSRELLKVGENVLAVEIHQKSASSSDLSFDLEFSGYFPNLSTLVSSSPVYTTSLDDDLQLTAVFNQTSNCILPDTVVGDLTLGTDCSPYLAPGDVLIDKDATLTIEPGVEIWMPEGASIFVNGTIRAEGSIEEGILIRLHPDHLPGSWGAISFRNTEQASSLKYVTMEDASHGPDPVLDKAAISAFHADLILDHLTLENNHGNPISARYSDIRLSNSTLHSRITGDLINVKYGTADISNCRFVGNDQPDTDAIDYDEIENGSIRNCQIVDFLGVNSDAIDLGEKAYEILIDSVFANNITDKGVSLGQRSTATIRNSVFVNCNMGVGIKDSSRVAVHQSVFYGNGTAVVCFEKNLGRAGGNATITNSIISNSSNRALYADSKSSLRITYSLTDSEILQGDPFLQSGNPLFSNPTFYQFGLLPGSPGILAGLENGAAVDAGIPFNSYDAEPSIMISRIFLGTGDLDVPEFIALYNPSSKQVDLSGYAFTKGITLTIPEGVFLGPAEILYLTGNANIYGWSQVGAQVLSWESGRLANEGETLQLVDSHGIVIDHLVYEDDGLWPSEAFSGNVYMQLIGPGLDNHFPESWRGEPVEPIINHTGSLTHHLLRVYPNPTQDFLTIEGMVEELHFVEIYNLAGQLLGSYPLEAGGKCVVDVSGYPAGVLLIRVGTETHKVIILD